MSDHTVDAEGDKLDDSFASPKSPSGLSLGMFEPSLTEQGFRPFLGYELVDLFEADDLAISRLHARGLITTDQHIKARQRLAKLILKEWNRLPRGGASSASSNAPVNSNGDT